MAIKKIEITKTVIFSHLSDKTHEQLNYILPFSVGDEITINDNSDIIDKIDWDFDNGIMYVTTSKYEG